MTHEREALERQLGAITSRLARLDSLPDEPEGEPCVIHFTLRFTTLLELNGLTKPYTHAAIRCSDDGLWYTTGPRSPKAYSWEQLAKWMLLDNKVVDGVWFAEEWERIA